MKNKEIIKTLKTLICNIEGKEEKNKPEFIDYDDSWCTSVHSSADVVKTGKLGDSIDCYDYYFYKHILYRIKKEVGSCLHQ